MKPRAARRRFFSLLTAYASELSLLSLNQGLTLMTRFYRYDRFTGCDPDENQDLLFGEWEATDWSRGNWFRLVIARQLIDGSKRGRSIRQLRLTFATPATKELLLLGSGKIVCGSPSLTGEFQSSVEGTAAYQYLNRQRLLHVELSFNPISSNRSQ